MGNETPHNHPQDRRTRDIVLGVLSSGVIAAFLATLSAYLGHMERVGVGVLVLVSLALLLADVLAIGFYEIPRPPWRWVTVGLEMGALVMMLLGLGVWVKWASKFEPPPERPKVGTYSGFTSQGERVEFDVVDEGGAIDRISFAVEGACPVGTSDSGSEPVGCTCEVNRETTMDTPWAIDARGFSYCPGEFEFSAVFDSSRTASGFLRIHTSGTAAGEAPCESGQVPWTTSLQ